MKLYQLFQSTLAICSLILLQACTTGPQDNAPPSDGSYIEFVNPFIGTGGHGHTYPGATVPFGMVQLSPDTRLTGWDGCSGYHYSDSMIYGFTHTHLSGTGVSDYGDILFIPLNDQIIWNNGANGEAGYRSRFSHENEKASPGSYRVFLDDPGVQVNLTVTQRGGIHQYTFEEPKQPSLLLDLKHRDEVLSSAIHIVSPTRIEGHRRSKAWATDQHVYFAAEFSIPFSEHKIFDGENESSDENVTGKNLKSAFIFPPGTKNIELKIALSAVDVEGAWKNFDQELNDFEFSEILAAAEAVWNVELSKINVSFDQEDEKTVFYSALYHTLLAPNLYMDVDGRYRDMDLNVYQSNDHTHYTVFSLWDTYRAAHPLYTIIDQKRTTDFIKTFIKKYESGGILPIWDLSACYTGCMIGNHAIPVIADAYIKGIEGYDKNKALESMIHSSVQDRLGLAEYKNKGFISVEKEAESVSKTLEYAYDDWCVAAMAQQMGDKKTYDQFSSRSLNYRNLFDPESKFFRGRMRNTWQSPFDPYEVNNNYTEANAWQYGFYVPHDMDGFISLHGGKEKLENKLDELFAAQTSTSGRDQADITGLIGQYAHGNEPSHHIAYLYNFLNKPWKTQEKAREITQTMYSNTPDGISGNEDCGQMSAWYVFSALGFYPVTPGTLDYVIGSPSVSSAAINLENGNTFRVTTLNNSQKNIYIQSVTLNGDAYTKSYISHSDIMAGGILHFNMGPKPNQEWGSKDADIPKTNVTAASFIPPPFIAEGSVTFIEKITVALGNIDPTVKTFFRFNDNSYQPYTTPLTVDKKCSLSIFSTRNGLHSDTLTTAFFAINPNRKITLQSTYAKQYHAGGDHALIDGIRGTDEFRTGTWQGYGGKDLECIIDLGDKQNIKTISCGFLQDQNSWIFMPKSVEFYISDNGQDFTLYGTKKTKTAPKTEGAIVEYFGVNKKTNARYVKMIARSLIKCPPWHKGYEYDGEAWIFADEIIIE